MITRFALRRSTVDTLRAWATDAGWAVYSPDDFPSASGKYPRLMVRTPRERKENIDPRNGPPAFNTLISLTVVGRVEATTEEAAELALDRLAAQIEIALLTNAQFITANEIQQFASVATETEFKADGETHLADVAVTFEIEVPQLFEMTIDTAGVAIAGKLIEIQGTVPNPAGTGVTNLVTFDIPDLNP